MILAEWISDLEAQVKACYDSRSAFQLHFLYDLQQTAECLGGLKLKADKGYKEKLFCYVPKKQQGLIIDREDGIVGTITSYGNITKDEFINRFYPAGVDDSDYAEEKKKFRHHPLLALPVLLTPAAVYAVKKYLEHSKEKDKERGNR
jgi:hypothetical protein